MVVKQKIQSVENIIIHEMNKWVFNCDIIIVL